MGTGSFPGVNRPGRGFVHPPHLAPKLKKEHSYTSTPPLGLRGLLYLYLYRSRGTHFLGTLSELLGALPELL